MDREALHRFLLDPSHYPDRATRVDFRETHISRVYLTDQFAYKFKKPLNLGFLDFSTLSKRRFFCHQEVSLNRRFSPEVYLDVVVLRQGRNGPTFGKQGRVLDYAVQMLRLPEERMLSNLLDGNDPDLDREMVRLAGHLAPLLAGGKNCMDEETVATVRSKLSGNLQQTSPFVGMSLSADAQRLMSDCMDRNVQGLAPLVEQRSREGFVRDGHGDLHAANICMTEPIRIYDCIEFCRRFRVADVAADLAFLLMDLDFRGRRDLSGIFLKSYQEQTEDFALPTLLPLYKSYRAWVRGKVNTLLATEGDVEPGHRVRALDDARRYFNLALGYYVKPALLMTSGLMGVGKSSLAKALASATGARLLRSDVVRKELAGLPTDRPSLDPFASGLYRPGMNKRTYNRLLRLAEAELAAGRAVIVDASFSRVAEREAFLGAAHEKGMPALILHVTCDELTTIERLEQRQKRGDDPSDGRREIYRQQAAGFADFSSKMPVMKIDSLHDVDYNVQQILCRMLQF